MKGFPRVVGAIDGTHIPIKAPIENPNEYINRKLFLSVQFENQICPLQLKDIRKSLNKIWVAVVENSLLSRCSIYTVLIKWPSGKTLRNTTERLNDRKAFPGVVSAFDGTHIPIKAPIENPNEYINQKLFPLFSLKNQTCPFQLKIYS